MESKSIQTDITGRVMALEQKLRGLQGRVSALEMRLSMESPDTCQPCLYDGTEFVSGESYAETPDVSALEGRLSAMEAVLRDKPARHADPKSLAFDLTALVVGLSLLAIGVLLSTDSFDILRNPMLAFGAGVAVLACAVIKLIK
jgi:hypothetical protein